MLIYVIYNSDEDMFNELFESFRYCIVLHFNHIDFLKIVLNKINCVFSETNAQLKLSLRTKKKNAEVEKTRHSPQLLLSFSSVKLLRLLQRSILRKFRLALKTLSCSNTIL